MGPGDGGTGLGADTAGAEVTAGGTAVGEVTAVTGSLALGAATAGAELTEGTAGAVVVAAIVAAVDCDFSGRVLSVGVRGVGGDAVARLEAEDAADGRRSCSGFFVALLGGTTIAVRLRVVRVFDAVVAGLRTTASGTTT